jgi:hypothetical protein
MPLWAKRKLTSNEGYFGSTSTTPYPTPSNRPSFASLPCDLHDDVMCSIHCRSFTNFEAKLGNPSLTCFVTKQATRCRHVSSHRLHALISFEAQTDKSPCNCFWGPNQETIVLIFRPKSPNGQPWFWGPNQETVATGFEAKSGETIDHGFDAKLRNLCSSSPCAWCRPHKFTRYLDRLAIEYPTYAWLSPVLYTKSPSPALILVAAHHAAPVT